MSGVRIQHPDKRNVTMTLVDAKRPLAKPGECAACHRIHSFKTYHFRLDDVGATIVSHEIAERLKRLPGHGFSIGETIAEPPAQLVDLNKPPTGPAIEAHLSLIEPS